MNENYVDGDSAAGGPGAEGAVPGQPDQALRPGGGRLRHVPRTERHAPHSVQVGSIPSFTFD